MVERRKAEILDKTVNIKFLVVWPAPVTMVISVRKTYLDNFSDPFYAS